MKYILIFIFLFLFVSCDDCLSTTYYDKRCRKIRLESYNKGIETGVCYKVSEDGPIMYADEVEKLHPDPKACNALWEEAKAKCEALPPPSPDDIVYTSGSSFGGRCD